MKTSSKVLLLAVVAATFTASAKMDVDSYDTTVTPGVWCGNFAAATNYVTQHDMPLVLIWGVTTAQYGECEHCAALTAQLKTANGLSWAESQDAVFCFVEGYNWADVGANAGSGAYDFAQTAAGTSSNPLRTTPFVCLYWPKRKVVSFTGMLGAMYSKEGSDLLAQFKNSYAKFISEVDISQSYASFLFGDTENDRLEAIAGVTEWVDVPVVRTNMVDMAATCLLEWTFGGVGTTTNITWAVGDEMVFARVPIPAAAKAGDEIALTLCERGGVEIAVRHIHVVAEPENSAKNPHWFGERTAETIGWGEWTMDFDIVTNKVAAFNAANPGERAYAMVLVEGCLWCPDCAMAEANFFDREEFKEWARKNRIVFGALDIPNYSRTGNQRETTPSLLRYETARASNSYVTLSGTAAADETERYQSGAGYLSRHSVPYDAALAVAERNRSLMGHDTLNGGWNRPENANKNRTGVPILLLLRGDGSVAARWTWFATSGPGRYSGGYLRRLEEMMEMINDADEEADDDKSTTRRSISAGDVLAGTVSSVDQADVYRIDEDAYTVVEYSVTGGGADLSARIVDADGNLIASTNGVAAGGFTVKARIGETPCFLRISPTRVADGGFFGYTNEVSTVCVYNLEASGFASGGDITFVEAAMSASEADGTVEIAVCRTNGCAGAASVRVVLDPAGDISHVSFEEQTVEWADGEMGVKYVRIAMIDDSEPVGNVVARLRLEGLSAAAADTRVPEGGEVFAVEIIDDDVFGTLVCRNVAYSRSIAVDDWREGDRIIIRKLSGSLPAGLSLSFRDGALALGGIPRLVGRYAAEWRVEVRRDGAVVSSQDVSFEFTVKDIDFMSVAPALSTVCTYRNLPVVGEDNRVKGILTLTVPATGRLSGKYMTQNGTFAYSAAAWADFNAVAGTLTAALSEVSGSGGAMTVTIGAGGGRAEFEDPSGDGMVVVEIPGDEWSDENPALAWAGQYTVQMPQTNVSDTAEVRLTGAAYMAMLMTNRTAAVKGQMLFAGVLPNGRAFSGTSALIAGGSDVALMPFFRMSADDSASYALSGIFEIDADAGNARAIPWSVRQRTIVCWRTCDAYDHSADLEVYGGFYNRDNVQALFDGDFSGAERDFMALPLTGGIVSGRHGVGIAGTAVALAMTGGTPSIVEGTANPHEMTLSFSPATGVVSGEMYVPFEGDGLLAVTYRGIALPGWQGCDTCAEGFVERPWATGSFSFSDRDFAGHYRNGGGIELGRFRNP